MAKKYLKISLISLSSLFLVTGTVFLSAASTAHASTTIGTNISTGGSLTVGGSPINPISGLYVGPDESTLPALLQNYTQAKGQLFTHIATDINETAFGVESVAGSGAFFATLGDPSGLNMIGLETDAYAGRDSSRIASFNAFYDANGFAVDNAYGVWINSASLTGGSIVNNIALLIDDQTGATNNYAIKTGAGMVEVGDATKAAGIHVQGVGAFDVPGLGAPASLWLETDTGNPFNIAMTNDVAGGALTFGMGVDDSGNFYAFSGGSAGYLNFNPVIDQWGVLGGASLQVSSWISTLRNTAPADADIAANEMALWFDPTNGASNFRLKAKQADGTVVTPGAILGTYGTATNCADSAGPAACGSAAAGRFVADAAATTVVVSTTAVTANSEIFIQYDSSLGTALGVTCNATIPTYAVTARTAGTSFTLTTTANVTNPGCYSYHIVN